MSAEGFFLFRWARSAKTFVRDSAAEMKRVIWPTWDELKNYTYLVVFVILVIAAWLGLFQFIFHETTVRLHLFG